MKNSPNYTKIGLYLLGIAIFFGLLLVGMFWYYRQYINSLNQPNTNITTTTQTSLLPTLTGNGEDTTLTGDGSVSLDTGSAVDNLNKVEDYDANTEILAGAKVVTLEDSSVLAYTVLQKQVATDTPKQAIIRYVSKKSGQVIDLDLVTGNKSILNTSPETRLAEGLFSKNGEYLILRKEISGDINTKLVYIPANTAYELDINITSLDFLDSGNLVYGVKKGDGYLIKTLDLTTKKTKELTTLPMTEWTLESVGGSVLRAYYKPTGYAEGISLNIDYKTGKVSNEVKPVNGLVVKKTSDSKYALLSEGGVGFNKLLFLNRNTQDIFSLSANTFLEKCAKEILKNGVVCAVPEKLDKQAVYPDQWYKGNTISKDRIVYKSLTSTSTKLLYTFVGGDFSVTNISVTPVGVFFQDSQNLKLYTIR